MKKVILLIGTILSLWFLLPGGILAQAYYYPMDHYFERQGVKGFGQHIDSNFYKGKESLFPFNRFYGYHTGIDLEILKGEEDKKVPVYAITQGDIVYIGNLSGYGGVILERIDGENNTVLYGHVKIVNLPIKTGDQVSSGQVITFLGDAFSAETSRERKHLHFGIYKGNDLYFRGHESSKELLLAKWEDPTRYLVERNALFPGEEEPPQKPLATKESPSRPALNIFSQIFLILKKIIDKLRSPP